MGYGGGMDKIKNYLFELRIAMARVCQEDSFEVFAVFSTAVLCSIYLLAMRFA